MENHRAILVGTKDQGLFFGWVPDDGRSDEDIFGSDALSLKGGRMIVYYNQESKGALGLAAEGPRPGCRITDPVDITVGPVTGVARVSDKALAVWSGFCWTP